MLKTIIKYSKAMVSALVLHKYSKFLYAIYWRYFIRNSQSNQSNYVRRSNRWKIIHISHTFVYSAFCIYDHIIVINKYEIAWWIVIIFFSIVAKSQTNDELYLTNNCELMEINRSFQYYAYANSWFYWALRTNVIFLVCAYIFIYFFFSILQDDPN